MFYRKREALPIISKNYVYVVLAQNRYKLSHELVLFVENKILQSSINYYHAKKKKYEIYYLGQREPSLRIRMLQFENNSEKTENLQEYLKNVAFDIKSNIPTTKIDAYGWESVRDPITYELLDSIKKTTREELEDIQIIERLKSKSNLF